MKYDVNPTLVRILTDMCDIYMTSYLDCEGAVISEMNCIRDLIDSGAKSASGGEDDAASSRHLLPQCTNESITSLLGGALKVIMDCRFALTEAVVDRHLGEMSSLAGQVAGQLQLLLLKVLRVLVLLPAADANALGSSGSAGPGGDHGATLGREECVAVLKAQYAQLLAMTTSSSSSSAVSSTSETCQTLYAILERLNSVAFLKQFLLIN